MSNNKLLDVINCVDDGQPRSETIEELSHPSFLIGSTFTVNKLVNKMIEMGLLYEKSNTLFVTTKGRNFYDTVEYDELN